jgi:hypothetical protein
MMRHLILLSSLFLGMGLSHAAEPTDAEAQARQKQPAQLIISRDAKVPANCNVELLLEEKQVAQLPAGESTNLEVAPGTLYLRAQLLPADNCDAGGLASGQSVLLEPGETRHYQLMFDNDALFLAPQLE